MPAGSTTAAGHDETAFWDWFANHADRLGVDFEDAALWSELAGRLRRVDPALEFGFGIDAGGQWWIAIGPAGRFEHLAAAARLVDAAPDDLHWNVRLGRQRRGWDDALAIVRAGHPDLPWAQWQPDRWRWALQSQLPSGHWSDFGVVPAARQLPAPAPARGVIRDVAGDATSDVDDGVAGDAAGDVTDGVADDAAGDVTGDPAGDVAVVHGGDAAGRAVGTGPRTNRLRLVVSAPGLDAAAGPGAARGADVVRSLATSLIGELAVLRWFESVTLVDERDAPGFALVARPLLLLAADWGQRIG